jgi:uncharacterized tellurite resistance protein B-like protein
MAEHADLEGQLRSLAFLYLAMGHGADNYLSAAELEAITDRLHSRYPDLERAAVQDVVGEAMVVYMESEDVISAATDMIISLRSSLQPKQRRVILEDLLAIAQADGVLLKNERSLLASLAESWEIESVSPEEPGPSDVKETWSSVHHLALIYLVLAHGTDNELSEQERNVMLRKLLEWDPRRRENDVREILQAALDHYEQGISEEQFSASVHAVREGMPDSQRMAALDDLVKIANADGVFLDREEDLINQLLVAWEIMPYASYGKHGSKE